MKLLLDAMELHSKIMDKIVRMHYHNVNSVSIENINHDYSLYKGHIYIRVYLKTGNFFDVLRISLNRYNVYTYDILLFKKKKYQYKMNIDNLIPQLEDVLKEGSFDLFHSAFLVGELTLDKFNFNEQIDKN